MVPFEYADERVMTVDFTKNPEVIDWPLGRFANRMAQQVIPYYDVFELLSTGKIKTISKCKK